MSKIQILIKNKLQSKRGMSILFAMFLFLVVSMVSITIVNAALSGAKTVHENRSFRQASLTLESAVQLVGKKMDGVIMEYSTTTEIASGNKYEEMSTTIGDTSSLEYEIVNMTNALRSGQNSAKVEGKISVANMEDVDMEMILSKNAEEDGSPYALVITFTINKSKESMYITFDGIYESEQTSSTTHMVKKEKYTWKKNKVSGYIQEK